MTRAGFPRKVVLQRFEAIDHANVSRLGFSRRRFPQSMYDTYQSFCIDYDKPFDETEAQRFQFIGTAVFEASPKIFKEVPETLGRLSSRGVRLILATKGDPEIQERRIETSRLGHYFQRTYILAHKQVTEFEQIVADCNIDASNGWSIGNSVKSDINPALAVGLSAIWIPYRTWGYEDEEPVVSSRLHEAKSIREVPRIIFSER
jgi:putative hydrolase of the HAD superfamily